MKQYNNFIPTFVSYIALGAFAYLLWAKLQLGLVRYFDADEFAYLHWAHNVFDGRVPYVDFLLYTTPGFLYVLAPLFAFAGGAEILSASRVLAWLIFAGMCITLAALFRQVRPKGSWGVWLLPGIILAALPLPSDKFLEVRPDNLATLIGLIGLMCHIRKKYMVAGIFYGLSLLVLPKTLPQVVIAVLVAPSAALFAGIGLPVFVFLLWLLSLGNFGQSWYQLTRLPFEVNRLGEIFAMQPDLFFYPNSTYYGLPGWNIGLLANHAIWMTGLLFGVTRLVMPYLTNGKKGVRVEVLLAGSFFVYIVSFMYGYPMRHAQYLIPIACFVALYVSDAIRKLGAVGVIGVIGAMVYVSYIVQAPKMYMTNVKDIRRLEAALKQVPKDSYVLDLTGATVYFKDPYPVSAVPFGQWERFLSRPLPNLSDVLEETGTAYIYQDQMGRIGQLSDVDQKYISKQYVPYGNWGLLVRAVETQ